MRIENESIPLGDLRVIFGSQFIRGVRHHTTTEMTYSVISIG